MSTASEDLAPSYIGILLAVIGSSLIGLSYTASKNAHNNVHETRINIAKNDADQSTESIGEESQLLDYELHEYSMSHAMQFKEFWISIVLLLAGEIVNFFSYAFAPTSTVAPLGTLSIISGALSGYFYLNERIQMRQLLGMMTSIAGATLIVVFSRQEEPQLTPEAIIAALCQVQFLIYLGVMVVLIAVLLILDKTKVKGSNKTFGDQNMLIRVSLTSIFSGITVLSTKSLASLIGLSLYLAFTYLIFYALIVVLLVFSLLTLYYTNKALARFDSSLVLPAEFAAFTINAVLGSALLYNDFDSATYTQCTMFAVGCIIIFLGVYLITAQSSGHTVSKRPSTILVAGGLLPVSFAHSPSANSFARPRSRTSRSAEITSHIVPNQRFSTWKSLLARFDDSSIEFGDQESASLPGDYGTVNHTHHHTDMSKRLTYNGMAGLASVLNALGTTRASLTFQQIVSQIDNQRQAEEEQVFIEAAPENVIVVAPLFDDGVGTFDSSSVASFIMPVPNSVNDVRVADMEKHAPSFIFDTNESVATNADEEEDQLSEKEPIEDTHQSTEQTAVKEKRRWNIFTRSPKQK